MRAVGLKVLKNTLSAYVRLAAGGERVLVMHRGRAGLIAPPAIPSPYPPARSPVAPLAAILAELDADRADR
jgi:hypothetical protein